MSKNYKSARIRGKLRVYQYLKSDKKLAVYLPYTTAFSKEALERLLSRYRLLYMKPNQGTHGKNVMQIKRRGKNDHYDVRSSTLKKSFKSMSKLREFLIKKAKQRYSILQEGIKLEKYKGNPYDIRVMVQRKPGGKWVCTGMFAKVGAPNKIVTNYYQGGKIVLLEHIFHHLKLADKQKSLRNHKLKTVSTQVAKTLSSRQKGMREMGIDYAFDQKGKLWIIEVNTNRPQFYPLKKISPKMYQKMLSFAKSYGRKSAY